jgi:hypothetical protein
MVEPPTYRADPDPEFADRLERVLLERLAAAPGRPDADPDHREGDIIVLDTEDPIVGPRAPWRRSPGRWLMVAAAVAVVAVAGTVLVAAGGDDEEPLDAVSPSTTAAPVPSCPFTADEVREIVGPTGPRRATSSTGCEFGSFPIVVFNYLPASTCAQAPLRNIRGLDYSDPVDGLGVEAYFTVISLGVSLLVCNGDRPFAVLVDGIQGDDLAAAVELARLVTDG